VSDKELFFGETNIVESALHVKKEMKLNTQGFRNAIEQNGFWLGSK
jgi:hypothetical protein